MQAQAVNADLLCPETAEQLCPQIAENDVHLNVIIACEAQLNLRGRDTPAF